MVCHLDDDHAWRNQVASAVGRVGFAEFGDLSAANLVILELWHRDQDGFQLAAQLKRRPNPPRVMALTRRSDSVAVYRSRLDQLDAFVWKIPAASRQLPDALRALNDEEPYFAQELLQERQRLIASPKAYFKLLSPTELSLLPFIGRFMSDESVAREVGMATRTVRWHRGEMLQRLGLSRNEELPWWAIQTGFAPVLLPAPPCLISQD